MKISDIEASYVFLELAMADVDDDISAFEESGGVYSIVSAISSTIKKIIIDMTSYVEKLKVDIDTLWMKREQSKKWKETIAYCKSPEGKDKVIQFANVKEAVSVYQKYMKTAEKELKRLINKSYGCRNINDKKSLENEIDKFDDFIDDFDAKVEEALSKTIKLRGEKAIEYVENCRRSQDHVYNYYYNLMREFELFRVDAERKIAKKLIDNEKDVIAHVGKLQSAMRKVSTKASRASRMILFKAAWYIA